MRQCSHEQMISSEGTERFVVLNNAVEDLLELLLKSNKRHSSNKYKKDVFVSSILSTVLVSLRKINRLFSTLESFKDLSWCPGPISLPLCGTIRTG